MDGSAQLLLRWHAARARTDALFRHIAPSALYVRPIPARHRLAFYLGHLDAFDWNLLGRRCLQLPSASATFDALFAFGIDPIDGNLPSDVVADWPRRADIEAYNRQTRTRLDAALLGSWPCQSQAELCWALQIAIEHREMHAETLLYMLQQVPLTQLRTPSRRAWDATAAPPSRQVDLPPGVATLGQDTTAGTFGWDNEFGTSRILVPAFAIDVHPVTNAAYQGFVDAGGYEDARWWSTAGWNWLHETGVRHPCSWRRRGRVWWQRGIFAEGPLPPAWPVYVSHAEASAYARWRGRALPTEGQWHRAAYGTPAGSERLYPWGRDPPRPGRGNLDWQALTPTPVHQYPAGRSAWNVADLLGNGWEWTRSVFAPLPDFAPLAAYPGYSADFFDGQHYVLKGGSFATTAALLRRSFRNWFQPHYPYVFATFRCVQE